MVGSRFLLFCTAMLALSAPLLAQRSTGTVAGRVIDRQTTRPIVGAQIRVAGTDRGALTDETGAYRGRPVDVAMMKDGSLLISDDFAGAIYRVTYVGEQKKQ